MSKTSSVMTIILLIVFSLVSGFAFAQELSDIKLPPPRTEGGKPLMQALKERRSMRRYSTKELPLQVMLTISYV